MKNIDSRNHCETRVCFGLELTCVAPLWNHPKTVDLYFANREGFLNYATERSNFWSCFSVKR